MATVRDVDEISTIAASKILKKKGLDSTKDKELDADEDTDDQIVK